MTRLAFSETHPAANLDVSAVTAGAKALAAGAYPSVRMRRSRLHAWSRAMVREQALHVEDLIWPLFVQEGDGAPSDIAAMPGVQRLGVQQIVVQAQRAAELGIPVIALFPQTPPERKDALGLEALNPDNLICRSVRAIREAKIDIGVLCDVALDPYTSHGHDGVLAAGGIVDNDATLKRLVQQGTLLAQAGADILAPSDMMDGRVGALRAALEALNFTDTMIMSYAVKYASSFYGPFRAAVGSAGCLAGDKKNYQMDPANGREALREAALDIAEGADMLMVKPGMPYLDILSLVKQKFSLPTFAYQVSGEYAMMRAAAMQGWLNYDAVMMESLLCFKRAGADGILTYAALDVAQRLRAG